MAISTGEITLIDVHDGEDGAQGIQGPVGPKGDNGAQGPAGNPGQLGLYAVGTTLYLKGYAEDGTLTQNYGYAYIGQARITVPEYSQILTGDGQGYVLFNNSWTNKIEIAKLIADGTSSRWVKYENLSITIDPLNVYVLGSFFKESTSIHGEKIFTPQTILDFERNHFMEILAEGAKTNDISDINRWAEANGIGAVFGRVAVLEMFVDKLVSNEAFIAELGSKAITLLEGGIIKSSNYSAGSAGFAIKNNGEVEFGSGTFRGNIISTDASSYSGSIKNGQLETSSTSGDAYQFDENIIMSARFADIMSAPIGFLEDGSTVTSLQAAGSIVLINPARNFSGSAGDLRPEFHYKASANAYVYNPCGMSPYVFYSTDGISWTPVAEEIYIEPYTNCYIGNDYHSGYAEDKGIFWFYRRTQRVYGSSYWYYHKIYHSADGLNWSYTTSPHGDTTQSKSATLYYLDYVGKWILINREDSSDRRVWLSDDISNVANWVVYADKVPDFGNTNGKNYFYNVMTQELWVECANYDITVKYATKDGLTWYQLASIPSDVKYFNSIKTVTFPTDGFGLLWGTATNLYKYQGGAYTQLFHPFVNSGYIRDAIWDSQYNRFVLIGYDYNSTDGRRVALAFTTDFQSYELRFYTFTDMIGQTIYNPTTNTYTSLSSQWVSGSDMGQYIANFTLSKQTTPVTKVSKLNVDSDYLDLSFNDDGNLTFPVSNQNKNFTFSASATIPERLSIKKDMNFEAGLNVNLNQNAKVYGAVFN
ncbi:MAG: hypothetical protein CVV46_08235 [Spirochaetae bacterium HGW-Spirochaetae-2]|jgi:hypothetical protein|nr:MAG: hypothetical protein CVV46_08235 [Spirochaetae bacterium HGW-Spirochaetae-2]